MKLISLNTFKGKFLPQIIEYLKKEDPDFIALQEVWSCEAQKENPFTTEYDTYNSLQLILNSFNEYYYHYSPVLKTLKQEYEVEQGNLILSKIQIDKKETHFINLEYDNSFVFPPPGVPYENEPRCMQSIRCKIKDSHLLVTNLHALYQINDYKGDSERVSKMIQKILSNLDMNGPLILCGDFNLLPDTKAMKSFKGKLRNLTVESGEESTKTSISKKAHVIDYVLVSEKINVLNFEVPDIVISDHKPLVLDFGV
jgi:endonuclease/exonuclease/phosphatase family metal-dependent hydrolase